MILHVFHVQIDHPHVKSKMAVICRLLFILQFFFSPTVFDKESINIKDTLTTQIFIRYGTLP